MTLSEYSKKVGEFALREYRVEDGSDLCFNLVEAGEIDMKKDSVETAARVVAQHIQQA